MFWKRLTALFLILQIAISPFGDPRTSFRGLAARGSNRGLDGALSISSQAFASPSLSARLPYSTSLSFGRLFAAATVSAGALWNVSSLWAQTAHTAVTHAVTTAAQSLTVMMPTPTIIERGMNLTRYAKAYDTTVELLHAMNPQIHDPNVIYAGHTLWVPTLQMIPTASPVVTPSPIPVPPDVLWAGLSLDTWSQIFQWGEWVAGASLAVLLLVGLWAWAKPRLSFHRRGRLAVIGAAVIAGAIGVQTLWNSHHVPATLPAPSPIVTVSETSPDPRTAPQSASGLSHPSPGMPGRAEPARASRSTPRSPATTIQSPADAPWVKGRVIARLEEGIILQHDAVPGLMPAMTMLFELKDNLIREQAALLNPDDEIEFKSAPSASGNFLVTAIQKAPTAFTPALPPIDTPPLFDSPDAETPRHADSPLITFATSSLEMLERNTQLANERDRAQLMTQDASLRPSIKLGVAGQLEPGEWNAGPQVNFQTPMPGSPERKVLQHAVALQSRQSALEEIRTAQTLTDQWIRTYSTLLLAFDQLQDQERLLALARERLPSVVLDQQARRDQAEARAYSAAADLIQASGPAAKDVTPEQVMDWARITDPQALLRVLERPLTPTRLDPASAAVHLETVLNIVQARAQGALTPFWRKLKIQGRFPASLWNAIRIGWSRSPRVDWEELNRAVDAGITEWNAEAFLAWDRAAAAVALRDENANRAGRYPSRLSESWESLWNPNLPPDDAGRLWLQISDDLLLWREAEERARVSRWSLQALGLNPDIATSEIRDALEPQFQNALKTLQENATEWERELSRKKSRETGRLRETLGRVQFLSLSASSLPSAELLSSAQADTVTAEIGPEPRRDIRSGLGLAAKGLPGSTQRLDSPAIPGRLATAGVEIGTSLAPRLSLTQQLVRQLKSWRERQAAAEVKRMWQNRDLERNKDRAQIALLPHLLEALNQERQSNTSPVRALQIDSAISAAGVELAIRQDRLSRPGETAAQNADAGYEAARAGFEAAHAGVLLAERSTREWTTTLMALTGGPSSKSFMLSIDPGRAVARALSRKKTRPEVVWAQSQRQLAIHEARGRYAQTVLLARAARDQLEAARSSYAAMESNQQTVSAAGESSQAERWRTETLQAFRRLQEAEIEWTFRQRELSAWETLFTEGPLSDRSGTSMLKDALDDIHAEAFDLQNPPSVTQLAVETAALQGLSTFIPAAEIQFQMIGGWMDSMQNASPLIGVQVGIERRAAEQQAQQARLTADASVLAVHAFEAALAHQKSQAEARARIGVWKGFTQSLDQQLLSSTLTPAAQARAKALVLATQERIARDAGRYGFDSASIPAIAPDAAVTLPYMDDPAGAAAAVSERCTCGTFEETRSPRERSRWGWNATFWLGSSNGAQAGLMDEQKFSRRLPLEQTAWQAHEQWRKIAVSETNQKRMKARMISQQETLLAVGKAWESAVLSLRASREGDEDRVRALERTSALLESLLTISARQTGDLSTLDQIQWEPNGIHPKTFDVGDFQPAREAPPTALQRTLYGFGIIKAVDTAAGTLLIQHDPIPGFMEDAMTMLFTASNAVRTTLNAFHPGDAVDFTLSIESDRKWISSLSLGTPPTSPQKVRVMEDWQFEDLEGKHFSLQSLQGKTVFVNHWATWCPFCISEMASIERLMQRYAGRSDVVFLLVTDERPDVVRAFMKEHRLPPAVFSRSRTPQALSSYALPATFIIGPEGTLEFQKIGFAEWDKVAPAVLDKILPQKSGDKAAERSRILSRSA